MTRALLVVDVQNDFTEGGALGVDGGDAVATAISRFLDSHAEQYVTVIASRDWHSAEGNNGGHFAEGEPDFVTTWPVHCVAGSVGAEYDPGLEMAHITEHVKKGQGTPAYSLFEGRTDSGARPGEMLRELGVLEVDVVGIATDYCVRVTALDALERGLRVRVLTDLIAGVAPDSSAAALEELAHAGAEVRASA